MIHSTTRRTVRLLGVLFALSSPLAAQPPLADRRITLESERWTLVGDLLQPTAPAPVPAVLLLHGAARDRRAYIPLAQELASRGVASLRIDLRGEGESTNLGRFVPGRSNALLDGTERDVAAALRWLRARPGIDSARVGVLGASYTGEAMAAAARGGAAGAAYVALSPGSLSDESVRAIDASGRPWWLIASRDERFAQSVVMRVPSMSRSARTTIVDGDSHASDLLSPHFVLNAEIADWFAAKLRRDDSPESWGALEPGAHAVGFRSETLPLSSGALRLDVWYPAQRSESDAMRFADYLRMSDDLRGATPGFPLSPGSMAATLATAIGGDSAGAPRAVVDRLLVMPMAARRDAREAAGRFPLVVWTPRYATTVAQSVLSEYLASHGFVVAYARPARDAVRMPFEVGTLDEKRAELEARVRDMRAAVAALEARTNVDASAIGTIAWSYTGEMATLFQQRERRVTLVAGLSTTLLNDWVYQNADALAALDTSRLEAAYALLTQRRGEPVRVPPALARARAGYLIEFPGVAHGSFNALEGYLPSLLGIERVQRWSFSGPAGARSYETTAVLLARLLRHHVTGRSPQPLGTHALMTGVAESVATARPAR